jgi:glycosyltransferase involved in cell wall biosynthesis
MNILIVTSIYPQEDDEKNIGVTPVVSDFAKEWIKAGHNVIVVHNSSRYPKFLYLIPEIWLKKINSKLGIVIPNKNQGKKLYSEKDGVPCLRLPMLKVLPKNKYSKGKINQQFNKIISFLNDKKFIPDVIIGHWENPQIPLLSILKRKFNAKTALVLHAIVYIKQNRYKGWANKYIKDIDVIGGRSLAISKDTKKILNLTRTPFICYSGIPDKYFDNVKYKPNDFAKKIPNSYLYVGRLIKRKNVNVSISVLKELYGGDEKFRFNVVGVGAEKQNLISLSNKHNLNNYIKFLGYRQRDKILELMSQTQVFIMISDNETFGLVYIEAMSRGCIVIASKSGGMDGIINHGYNGFLCEQGNENNLMTLCKMINEMSIEEKELISHNAIKTASNFKNSKVAQRYLDTVINE